MPKGVRVRFPPSPLTLTLTLSLKWRGNSWRSKLKIDKTIEENHEAKLVVEIDPELMDKYKRRAARKISERGKIAGFRPG